MTAGYFTGTWICAKFAGKCWRCSCAIIRGDTVKFFAAHRRVLCQRCGERAESTGATPAANVNASHASPQPTEGVSK